MTCSCSPEKKKKKERERKERKVSVGWCRHANQGDRRRRLSLPHVLKIERESRVRERKRIGKRNTRTYRLWSPCSFCSVSSSKKPSSSVPPRGVFLRPLLFFRKRRCCCCCCCRSPSSPSFPSSSSSRVYIGNRRTHITQISSRRLSLLCREKSRVFLVSSSSPSFFLFFFSKTLNPKPFLFFGCAHNRRPFLSMGGSFTPPPK